jgi:ethanolamine utilization protein EutQ (cupin superfamily)
LDEKDWCTKGHVGYVLEGRFAIDFSANIVEFKAGDGLFIPPGEDNKHKAKVRKGDKALLILFEER